MPEDMRQNRDRRFDQALAAHQRGDLAHAETAYRDIVASNPRHADGWHLLGVVALQRNQPSEALARIDRAIALNDRVTFFHNNRGLALRNLQRPEEAIAAFERALALDSRNFDAIINLGNAHRDLGASAKAEALYRRGLALRPNDVAAINNLGTLASDAERDVEAEKIFRQAIAVDPKNHESWNNLGLVLTRQNRLTEARAVLERGLQLAPASAALLNNFGNVMQRSGDLGAAETAYQRALSAEPNNADALGNYGNLLRERGQLDAAVRHLQQAIALRPKHAEYYNNLGLVFQRAGQHSRAIEFFNRAVTLKPGHARAWNNLGGALGNVGEYRAAESAHLRAEELQPAFAEAGSNRLFVLHYSSEWSIEKIAAEHRGWAERYARHHYPAQRVFRGPGGGRRLRIGYVSPDFRAHSVGYFIEAVLKAHDRRRFEIFAYSDVVAHDARTDELSRLPEHWISVSADSDDELAARVRSDGIDILVDLAGHTARNRLLVFARAPATRHVTFVGYPNTTGLATMDFRLTDARADPPGLTEALHTETLIRLPKCAWCYSPPAGAPPVGPLPAVQRGYLTFGCFNNLAKVSSETLAMWLEIMSVLPNSRLVLKANPLADPNVRESIWTRFEAKGIPRSRVLLWGWDLEPREHLGRYGEIDLALDTFPYHGTTTTCEALWMGVPVITLVGMSHLSRVGVSLLESVGLPGFVAVDRAQYIACAVAWADRIDELAVIRHELRPRMQSSPLTDADGYTRALESIYDAMIIDGTSAAKDLEVLA